MRDERFDDPIADTTLEKKLKAAWGALQDGVADRDQGNLIIDHLQFLSGYYAHMELAKWIAATGSTVGFDIACVEAEGARSVFARVIPYLSEQPDKRFRT